MENNPTSDNVVHNKARYLLAKATSRLLARIIDVIITTGVSIALCCLLLSTDPNGIGSYPAQHWRYFMCTFFTVIVFFSYFICLPYMTKGRTLGFLILKLRIYNLIATKNFFICLIKREFFIWIINALCLLILGIILSSVDDPESLIRAIIFNGNASITGGASLTFISTLFQVIFSISFISLIFVAIHLCLNSRKRCFIDRISDTCVIKLIDVNSKDPDAHINVQKPVKRNFGLPGEIVSNASDEIDRL